MSATVKPADDVASLYESAILPLPPSERFKLAARILADIPAESIVDYDDRWSEEDMRELTEDALLRFDSLHPDDEDLV